MEVEKLAYELWEKDGRQHGRDEEYYLTAERMLAGQNGATAVAEAPVAKTAKPRAARSATAAKPRTPRAKKQA